MNNSRKHPLLNPSYITLFFVNMIASISFSMVSTIMTLFLCDSGYTATLAGTVVGLLSVAAMVIRPLSGFICDQVSRKRLLTIAMIGIMLSMVGYAMVTQLVLLYALRILHGICFSLVTTVTLAMVADCIPHDRRSQGMGLFSIGQTITLALAPTLGLWLAENISYTATFFGAAAFALISVLLSAMVYHEPKQASVISKTDAHKLTLNSFFAKETIWFAIIAMSVSATTGIENSFVVVYGRCLNARNVGWYFTLSAVALFVSRLTFGRMADRYGMKYVLYPGLAVIAGAFILMSRATSANQMVVFALCAVLKALGLGAVQPTLQAASIEAVSEKRRGAASATYYLGTDIGQSAAPILGGITADAIGYSGMFMIFALPLLLTGAICAIHNKLKG